MKCVVSGCPNRRLGATRGAFSRPPKRFFSFPEDPARVKVWLAALRETDRRDLAEQHLICEDHFLPEDISSRGVSADAIPLMPPCLDPSTISRWGGDSSEEEEEQWAAAVKLPVVDPPQQSRHRSDRLMTSLKDSGVEKSKEDKTTSESLCQRKETIQTRRDRKPDTLMQVLTQGFLELLLTAPGGELDLRQAATKLDTSRQRVNSIINILSGISLIKKQSVDRVQWTGSCPIRSFLWTNQEKFRKELEDMELEEETLDTLISSCSLQLLELTEDQDNSAMAYVSHQDLRRLSVLREQTVMVVKAPEESTLEVSAPTEHRIQVHMKGSIGPITVLTSDIGTGDVEVGEKSSCFITLEESRVKMAALHTES